YSDPELHSARAVVEPERAPDVVRENEQEDHRDIEKVAVHVLEDQRKIPLAQIALSRLTHGAVERIGPERLVVRAAIVVARESEQSRKRQDDQRGRERQESWPPARLRAEQSGS